MISASSEFKKCVKNGHKFVNYADITLKDGTVLNLGPADFTIGGFNMTDKTTDGKFGVGFAIGKTINMTIANHTNKFYAYDFYKSIIYVYVAIELSDGTVLKERKGKYYVLNPATPGDTIKISGVDSMHLFDKEYKGSIQFPATLQTILSTCCTDCGVNIGFNEFDNWNFTVYEQPEECTYRQLVSWVAQIAGYNARISNNDALELVWYASEKNIEENTIDGGNFFLYELEDTVDGGDFTNYEADITIDGGNFTDEVPENITKINSLSVSTDDVVITGVKVEFEDVSILRGIEGYVINVKNNPFVAGVEEAVADYLFKRIAGMQFRPLKCQTINNPLFEPFDSCYVYDRKGNSYFTLINSITYTISGFTTIACNAADPVRNESSYTSEAARALVEARRNTKKQLTTYDKAVQNMNLLAANSMGLYRESEQQSDGSVIYYMSNRPILKNENGACEFEIDSVVYKMTSNGFFVSEDGGITYTSGFDAEGNAVVNVLSAIGITFDWAKGGTLTLGGDNNINGEMVVYNASGELVGKFNKDGLWASNGYFQGDIVSTNATITGGTIKIKASALNYDIIDLAYGNKKTQLRPDYLRLENTTAHAQLTSSQIAVIDTSRNSYLSPGLLVLSSFSKDTAIQGNEALFGGYVNVGGDLLVSGDATISGDLTLLGSIKSSLSFSSSITIQSTGSLTLNGAASLTCNGKATFNNGIYGGTNFSVSTLGNIETSGTLTVGGTTTLKGTVKICDATYDTLGFFGSSGSNKKTVSNISSTSSATTSTIATKLNDLLTALRGYGLIG